MKTNWHPRYDRLISDLDHGVQRESYTPEAVPQIVDGIRDELHYLMQQFNAFTHAQYRDFFVRLKEIEQNAKAVASLPPRV